MQQKPDVVPLPDELRGVPRSVLEEYVSARLRQFSRVFGGCLSPHASATAVEAAFSNALGLLGSNETNLHWATNCIVKFRHRCRFLGCANTECVLCKNNPNKRCLEDDNFDECYADCQLLRSKCEADIYLDVTNALTGLQQSTPGMELQVCVVDGESWSETTASVTTNVKRLLKSDEGDSLLASTVSGTKTDAEGYLYLKLQDGQVRLPDVNITDKNDTFHLHGESYGTFRLMAQAVKRDLFGRAVPIESIPPAISGKFIVKTQRALNDYRKSEYPHYKDELTKLKFIGSITAQRLREIQAHLGFDVPFTSIETVEQLKHLMLYADQNRQVESKLLELLNMKGKHKQKWDYLREILNEKIVYDDMLHRAWYADESLGQGLLFTCRQGQVNLEKPVGIFRRLHQGAQPCLQVFTQSDPATGDVVKAWRAAAEQAWAMPGHGRWAIAQERLELVSASPGSLLQSPSSLHRQMSGAISPAMSAQDPMDDAQAMYMRQSAASSPHSHSNTPSDHRVAPHGMGMDIAQPHAMPGHMSYAFHSASPRGGSAQGDYASSLDPAAGVFHFTSGPNTLSPRSEPLVEMYQRTSSSHMPRHAGRSSLQSHLSTGSHDNAERSGRYRRMSADAMPAQGQRPMATQRSAVEAYYTQPGYTDMGLLKRPRSSAPSGLEPGEELGAPQPQAHSTGMDAAGLERGRVSLYHAESHGRHLPRGRKSQENLALPPEPDNHISAALFDAHDIDIDHLLQGIDGPGYGIKSEDGHRSSDPMLLNMQLQQITMGGSGRNLTLLGHPLNPQSAGASLQQRSSQAMPQMTVQGPPQHMGWQQHDLSAGIQHTLNLAEPSPTHHQQLQQQQQLHLDRAPMMMAADSDSFKSLNRALRHSDSDSFKHLLSSHQLGGQFNLDQSFNEALQDIIQGRRSSGNG